MKHPFALLNIFINRASSSWRINDSTAPADTYIGESKTVPFLFLVLAVV